MTESFYRFGGERCIRRSHIRVPTILHQSTFRVLGCLAMPIERLMADLVRRSKPQASVCTPMPAMHEPE